MRKKEKAINKILIIQLQTQFSQTENLIFITMYFYKLITKYLWKASWRRAITPSKTIWRKLRTHLVGRYELITPQPYCTFQGQDYNNLSNIIIMVDRNSTVQCMEYVIFQRPDFQIKTKPIGNIKIRSCIEKVSNKEKTILT